MAGSEKEVVFLTDVMLVVAVLLGVGRIKAVTTVVEMESARQRLRRSCMVVMWCWGSAVSLGCVYNMESCVFEGG